MKKLRKALSLVLLLAVLLALTACESDVVLQYMDYGIGVDENGNYNTDLYMENGVDLYGADPGCFFVTTQEDPEYGGYYYMYITGYSSGQAVNKKEEYKDAKALAYQCYRSKDLNNWDLCGVLEGYSLWVDQTDWCSNNFWAPEVIRNPADGKYYMYFSADYNLGLKGEGISESNSYMDRQTLGVAVSDTPVGPFDVFNDVDPISGDNVPTVNFKKGCNTEYDWGTIDASPFFDEDGTLYLYFAKTGGTHVPYDALKGCWGMKMKSMTEPDYSTVSCLTIIGYESAQNVPGKIESVELGNPYWDPVEGTVNEAPYMIKQNGMYYLTYSSHGYGDPEYSVHQAISTDPLQGFVKVAEEQGNPVLKGSQFEYMAGTGHHAFARCGEDVWIIYHRHDSVYTYRDRVICADRVNFVTNSEGVQVMTTNGPSMCLQWQSQELTGYANLAKQAAITVDGATGAEYLKDEVLPYYMVTQDRKVSFDGDITVTLKWDTPVDASAVMIYNSNIAANAFSKVADIRFKTTEQKDGKAVWKVIKNLEVPERYYDEETAVYMVCAPAVADFEPISVTELQITIKAGDRLLDVTGPMDISEIVVLGGKTNE